MKLYATELIPVTSPSENILALDALRSKYGEPQRDERGSFWEVDEEIVSIMPAGVTFNFVRQE